MMDPLHGRLRRATGVALRAGRVAALAAPAQVARRTHVDPTWRRIEDGYAARLGPRETIDVARPVGRWRQVDPRQPLPLGGLARKAAGFGLWAGAVGVAWWVGSSRGRGPLAGVAELDRLGEAVGDATRGFGDD